MDSSRIHLRVSNQTVYVWDVNDIEKLRSEHHICGILTGTLPHLSQQNVFLGLPLVLMPEEVVLLVEKKLAVLIDDPLSHRGPTNAELQRWDDGRKEEVKHQLAMAEARVAREASRGRAMTEAATQKRKERQKKKIEKASGAALPEKAVLDSPSVASPDCSSASHSEQPNLETLTSNCQSSLTHSQIYTVIIPASSNSFEWYDPVERTYSDLAAAKAAGIWCYPETLHQRARCGVFRGLWEQGYFIGSGIKFGGDYLVYPGDPLRYHSHFIATVLDSPTSPLLQMEIVAHGRLGTATKKSHLLCGWDDDKRVISYFSIEWAGFG